MQPLTKILVELEEIGFAAKKCEPDSFDFALAVIEYLVPVGRYRARHFKVGIGLQEEAYPEYPPHWICVESLPESNIHQHSEFTYGDANWKVFSVPPSDFWDGLPVLQKNMKTYFSRHMTRFWSQV